MKQAHYDDELLREIKMFSWQQGVLYLPLQLWTAIHYSWKVEEMQNY